MHQTFKNLGTNASPTPKPAWCLWSTTESIQNEVPSVTAILETLIAVPFYWWIALRVGVIYPLLIGVVLAPLVLLRSEASVALGVKWFVKFQEGLTTGVSDTFMFVIIIVISLSSIIVSGLIVRHLFGTFQDWQIEFTIGIILIVPLFLWLAWTIFCAMAIIVSMLSRMATYAFAQSDLAFFLASQECVLEC